MATKTRLAELELLFTGKVDKEFVDGLKGLSNAIGNSSTDLFASARGIRAVVGALNDIKTSDVKKLQTFTDEFQRLISPVVGRKFAGLETLRDDLRDSVIVIGKAAEAITDFGKLTEESVTNVSKAVSAKLVKDLRVFFRDLRIQTADVKTETREVVDEYQRFFELSKKYISARAAEASLQGARYKVTRLTNAGASDDEVERAKSRLKSLQTIVDTNKQSSENLILELNKLARTLNLTSDDIDKLVEQSLSALAKESKDATTPVGSLELAVKTLRSESDKLKGSLDATPLDRMVSGFEQISKQLSFLSLGVLKTWGDLPKALGDDADVLLRSMLGPFEKAYDVLVGNSIVPDLRDKIVDIMGTDLPKDLKNAHQKIEDAMVDPFDDAFNTLVGNTIIKDLKARIIDIMGNELVQGLVGEHSDIVSAMVSPFLRGSASIETALDRVVATQQDKVKQLAAAVQKANEDIDAGRESGVNLTTAKARLAVEEAKLRAAENARARLVAQQATQQAAPAKQAVNVDVGISSASIQTTKQELADIERTITDIESRAAADIDDALRAALDAARARKTVLESELKAAADTLAAETASAKQAVQQAAQQAATLRGKIFEALKGSVSAAYRNFFADEQVAEDEPEIVQKLNALKQIRLKQEQAYTTALLEEMDNRAKAVAALATTQDAGQKKALEAEILRLEAEIKQRKAAIRDAQQSQGRIDDVLGVGDTRQVQQIAARDETSLISFLGNPSRLDNAFNIIKNGGGVIRGLERAFYGANEPTTKFGQGLSKVSELLFGIKRDSLIPDGPLKNYADQLSQVSTKSANLYETIEKEVSTVNQRLKTEGLELINIEGFRNSRRVVEREIANITTNIRAGGKVSQETLENAFEEFNRLRVLLADLQQQAAVNPYARDLIAQIEPQLKVQEKFIQDIYLLNKAQEDKVEKNEKVEKSERRLFGAMEDTLQTTELVVPVFRKAASATANLATSAVSVINPLQRMRGSLAEIRNVALGVFGGNLLTRLFDVLSENLGSGARQTTAIIEEFSLSLQARLVEVNQTYREKLLKEGVLGDEVERRIKERSKTITDNVLKFLKDFTAKTKFELEDTIDGFNRLLGAKLDPTIWLEPIANVATAMNKPVNQVVDAITTLSTGDKGEAVQRLRDLGLSVEDLGFKFGSMGELITPVPEALDKLYKKFSQAPEFAGQAISAAGSLRGSLSTLADTLKGLGSEFFAPVFASITAIVAEIAGTLENEGLINGFAKVGQVVGTTITTIYGYFKEFTQSQAFKFFVDAFKLIAREVGNVVDAIKERFEQIKLVFKDLAGGSQSQYLKVFAVALEVIRGVLRSIADIIRGDFQPAIDRLKGVLETIGVIMGNIFLDLAEKAVGWAGNIVISFADSFASTGMRVITEALNAFTSVIAYFLEGFSPPKGAPLNKIDTWGSNLAATFAGSIEKYDPTKQVQALGGKIADAVKGFDLGDFDLADSIFGSVDQTLATGLQKQKVSETNISLALEQARARAIDVVNQLKAGADAETVARDYVNTVLGGVVAPTQELIDKITADLKAVAKQEEAVKLEKKITELQTERDKKVGDLERDLEDYNKTADIAVAAAEKTIERLNEQAEAQEKSLDDYQKATDVLIERSIKAAGLFVSEAEQAKVDRALDQATKDVQNAESRLDAVREANARRGLTLKTAEEINLEASLEVAKQREKEAQLEVDRVEQRKQQAADLEAKIQAERAIGQKALEAQIAQTREQIATEQKNLDSRNQSIEAVRTEKQNAIDTLREFYDSQIKSNEDQRDLVQQEAERLAEIAATKAKAIELQLQLAQEELARQEQLAAASGGGTGAKPPVAKIDVPKFLVDKFGQPATIADAVNSAAATIKEDLNTRLNSMINRLKIEARDKLKGFWNDIIEYLETTELGQAIKKAIGALILTLSGLLGLFVANKIINGIRTLVSMFMSVVGAIQALATVNPIILAFAAAIAGLVYLYFNNRKVFDFIIDFFKEVGKAIKLLSVAILQQFVRIFDTFARDAQGHISVLKLLTAAIGSVLVFKGTVNVFNLLGGFLGFSVGLKPVLAILASLVIHIVRAREDGSKLARAFGDLVVAFQPLVDAVGKIAIILATLSAAFSVLGVVIADIIHQILVMVALPVLTFFVKLVAVLVNQVLKPVQFLAELIQRDAEAIQQLGIFVGILFAAFGAANVINLAVGFIVNFNAIVALGIVAVKGYAASMVAFAATVKAAVFSMTGLLGLVVAVTAAIAYFIVKNNGGIENTKLGFKALTGQLDEEFDKINRSSKKVTEAFDQIAKSKDSLKENITFDIDPEVLRRVEGTMIELEAKIEQRKDAVRRLYDAVSDGASEADKKAIIEEARALDREIGALTKQVAEADKAFQEQAKAMKAVQRASFEAGDTFEEYNNKIYPGMTKKIKEVNGVMSIMDRLTNQVRRSQYEQAKATYEVEHSLESLTQQYRTNRDSLSQFLSESEKVDEEYKQERIDAETRYTEELTRLSQERNAATTEEERAAIDEQIGMLKKSYADEKKDRDAAYEQERIDRKKRLAELLIDTITAATERQIAQGNLTEQEVAALRANLAKQTEQIALANGILETNMTNMANQVIVQYDKWTSQGGTDINEFIKIMQGLGFEIDEATATVLNFGKTPIKPTVDKTLLDEATSRLKTLTEMLDKLNGREISVRVLVDTITGATGGGKVPPPKNPYGPNGSTAFATGTASAPGGWALVGEEGEELIYLPRGARVFKSSTTKDMLRSPDRFAQVIQRYDPNLQRVGKEPADQLKRALAVMRLLANRTEKSALVADDARKSIMPIANERNFIGSAVRGAISQRNAIIGAGTNPTRSIMPVNNTSFGGVTFVLDRGAVANPKGFAEAAAARLRELSLEQERFRR